LSRKTARWIRRKKLAAKETRNYYPGPLQDHLHAKEKSEEHPICSLSYPHFVSWSDGVSLLWIETVWTREVTYSLTVCKTNAEMGALQEKNPDCIENAALVFTYMQDACAAHHAPCVDEQYNCLRSCGGHSTASSI
jgi:hypothetical protein